jgi:hypothetical protein
LPSAPGAIKKHYSTTQPSTPKDAAQDKQLEQSVEDYIKIQDAMVKHREDSTGFE